MFLVTQAKTAKTASKKLAFVSTESKNKALYRIAEGLKQNTQAILEANAEDVILAQKSTDVRDHTNLKRSNSMIDRLMLNEDRIKAIAADVIKVAVLKDYVDDVIEDRVLKNAIRLQRVRVPIGVIGCIIESRPNVTVDVATLCLKSGNAVFIKGGSEAINTNRVLVRIMKEALGQSEVPFEAVQFLDSTDRAIVHEFLKLHEYIDLMIPRGSQKLIQFVRENASMPVIGAGGAIVHLYIDKFADVQKAVPVVINSKTRRVSICNALDTLLIHKDVPAEFFEKLKRQLEKYKVKIYADKRVYALFEGKYPYLQHAGEMDFDREFLDFAFAVKMVDSMDEAMEHIEKHGLRHTDAIVTEDHARAERFLKSVDSACVYHNISTQFTDGGQFGLGSEVAISTQKLHARGPFALEGLTTYKWIARGNGQVREP
ncbi:glutamate-5-semialdehyde dehydrogenase [Candidatus Peregrinibacteria bacterium]|nr:glutamate-5-semialdehyde dehydrogenase [Candidatus Peregrinibacteria bacterium]